ncbi:MAG: class I SAM-dependent methyltransferase [Elusimicrobiota bacterium]
MKKKNLDNAHIDPMLGKYKAGEFRSLVKRWAGGLAGEKILKTDLREEAYGTDEILFSPEYAESEVFGIDISEKTVNIAMDRSRSKGLKHIYKMADVRNIPFYDNSFDMIFSTSTLDHFNSDEELVEALTELKRVIKPGGKLIITYNNKSNCNFRLMLKIEKMMRRVDYTAQTHTASELKGIIESTGWTVEDIDYCVHIISPANTLLLLMRKYVNDELADRFSQLCLLYAGWAGKRKFLKVPTAWFVAASCTVKKDAVN